MTDVDKIRERVEKIIGDEDDYSIDEIEWLCDSLLTAVEALESLSRWELHFIVEGGLYGEPRKIISETCSTPAKDALRKIAEGVKE